MIKLHLGVFKTETSIAFIIKFEDMVDSLRMRGELHSGNDNEISIYSHYSPQLILKENSLFIPGESRALDYNLIYFRLSIETYPHLSNTLERTLTSLKHRIYNGIYQYNNNLSNDNLNNNHYIQIVDMTWNRLRIEENWIKYTDLGYHISYNNDILIALPMVN